MNERLQRLEEKAAYLERHVTEQDKVILQLGDQLAKLRLEVRTHREQVGLREPTPDRLRQRCVQFSSDITERGGARTAVEVLVRAPDRELYAGANGTGSLIGQVLASDLYSNFSNIENTQDPGFLVSFLTPEKYGSVVFTTGSSDFEFAAVPEPSTWAMLGIGFAGLALAGYKRSRNRLAPALG